MHYLSPFGEPCGTANIKSFPQDFQVTEIPSFTPSGEGEHLWLWIKKTGANTAWVAEQLARQSGLKLRDVSYAGRKDKLAVTEQWFSLYDPKRIADKIVFELPDCEILKSIRHSQKLRIGNLLGNLFEIRLRNFTGNIDAFSSRVKRISSTGFPNYFGLQRFGRNQANITKAIAWVEKGGGRLRRDQRSLYLSVLRSFLFNLVLTERIKNQTWNSILDGEIVQLSGTHSVFVANPDSDSMSELQNRCNSFDLNPTGPLYGAQTMLPAKEAAYFEHIVLNDYPLICEFLEKETNCARRSLRSVPSELHFEQDDTDIVLKFNLPAGSYATILLGQFIGSISN